MSPAIRSLFDVTAEQREAPGGSFLETNLEAGSQVEADLIFLICCFLCHCFSS